MKTILALAAAVVTITSIPLVAQQMEADASASAGAYANTGVAKGGFGDEAASRSFEMTSVTGELQGKLDSKNAKPGDHVTLKTTEKVQTSDGTVIPKGSRLLGRVTEVQSHANDRAIAQMGIAFDHAELKNGQSVQIHSLIRTVRPSPSVSSMNSMSGDDSMSAGMSGGGRMGGGGRGGVLGGALGAGGNAPADAGSLGGGAVNGTIDRTGNSTAAGTNTNVGANVGGVGGVDAREDTSVQVAGHGDGPVTGGAHAAAAARAVPHTTGIPGVLVAGSSTSSGLFINSDRHELQLENGTRFELGVVADR